MEINQNVVMIGITGKKFAGKDTTAGIIMEYLFGLVGSYDTWKIVKYSMADPIREIGLVLGFTMDEMLDPVLKEQPHPVFGLSWRVMAQRIGTDMFREHIDPEIWVKIAMQRAMHHASPTIIVIPDIRFDNECEMVLKHAGFVFNIVREGCVGDSHKSEQGVCGRYIGNSISNNGTLDDLRLNVQNVLEKWKTGDMLKINK